MTRPQTARLLVAAACLLAPVTLGTLAGAAAIPASASVSASRPSAVMGLSAGASSKQSVKVAAPAAYAALAATSGCKGDRYAQLPVSGDIRNSASTLGGYFWYKLPPPDSASVCIGTLRMYVHYTATGTKTWRVHALDGATRFLIAERTFTLPSGWYYWDFPIHEEWAAAAICAGATDTPGYSCHNF
jgi:hypothetical protein